MMWEQLLSCKSAIINDADLNAKYNVSVTGNGIIITAKINGTDPDLTVDVMGRVL